MNRERAKSELVVSADQIEANAIRLHLMATGSSEREKFHRNRVKNGKVFVVVGTDSGMIFAPSKFCGYADNDTHHLDRLNERHGSDTNKRISAILGNPILPSDVLYSDLEEQYKEYCSSFGFYPSHHPRPRRYWIVSSRSLYPDEVSPELAFVEGAATKVLVNRYERDPKARAACLDHFGYTCRACGFNFDKFYGPIGKEFIHVHHIDPLAAKKKRYTINPIRDLIPVCPNCHAMLHRGKDLLSISELRKLISQVSKL